MSESASTQDGRARGEPRSRGGRLRRLVIIVGATVLGAGMAVLGLATVSEPHDRHLTIRARQYAYDPPVIRVNLGDRLHIRLVSQDVVHGFFLEGHDVDAEIHPQQPKFKVRHPSKHDGWQESGEIVVVAKRAGKFRYRCSHTCGYLHPFMNGELVVGPNHLFHAGLGAAAGLLLAVALLVRRKENNGPKGPAAGRGAGDEGAAGA